MADSSTSAPEVIPLPILSLSTPIVVPAMPSITYKAWWVNSIRIRADDPANVVGSFQLVPYAVDQDGIIQFSLTGSIAITVEDILNDPDPDIQKAVSALLTAIQTLGQKQGLL